MTLPSLSPTRNRHLSLDTTPIQRPSNRQRTTLISLSMPRTIGSRLIAGLDETIMSHWHQDIHEWYIRISIENKSSYALDLR